MTERCEPTPSRAAVLTPAGRGAVAVVAIEGPAAIAALDEAYRPADGRAFAAQPVGRVAYGRFLREEVIVCKLSASSAEVHCHGGRAAADRILNHFAGAGCDIVPWEAWKASFDALPIVERTVAAEARRALAHAATLPAAAILLDQFQGPAALAAENFAARIEAGDHAAARQLFEEVRGRATWGSRLIDPPRIVLGWLAQCRQEQFDQRAGWISAEPSCSTSPGTTRDVLSAQAALNGWPVLLVDVAGLRAGSGAIEAVGVDLARRQLETADLVLWVLDAAEIRDWSAAGLRVTTEHQIGPWQVKFRRPPVIVVNKIDLAANLGPERADQIVPVSALTGEGVAALAQFAALQLFPKAPRAGQAVPFTARQIAALDAAHHAMKAGNFTEAVARVREYAGGE